MNLNKVIGFWKIISGTVALRPSQYYESFTVDIKIKMKYSIASESTEELE